MNPSTPSPVILILASGSGVRFRASGGLQHKLEAPLQGKPVLDHVIAAAAGSGLPWRVVRGVSGGMGHSIAAGVAATPEADGWLILPGDLPLVRATSLQRVAAQLQRHTVVVPHWNGQKGHPVGFAATCRSVLQQLQGDTGAAAIVKQLRQRGQSCDLALDDEGIVADVDTLDDLRRIEEKLRARHP